MLSLPSLLPPLLFRVAAVVIFVVVVVAAPAGLYVGVAWFEFWLCHKLSSHALYGFHPSRSILLPNNHLVSFDSIQLMKLTLPH
jgi:hypothetical protein